MKDSMAEYIRNELYSGNTVSVQDIAEMYDLDRNQAQTSICLQRNKVEKETKKTLICDKGIYFINSHKDEQKLEMGKRKLGTISKIKTLGRVIATTARLFPKLIPEIEQSMLEVSQTMGIIRLKQLKKQLKGSK